MLLAPLLASLLAAPIQAPVELGRVAWQRDFHRAQAEAHLSAKPILLLFQEVPG